MTTAELSDLRWDPAFLLVLMCVHSQIAVSSIVYKDAKDCSAKLRFVLRSKCI